MLYTDAEFQAEWQSYQLKNTNDWMPGDEVILYIALSCPSWLGNFNRIEL